MKRIKAILESKASNKDKVDKLLEYDCHIHMDLGLDSTENERKEVSMISDKIIDEVIKIDPDLKYLKESRNT